MSDTMTLQETSFTRVFDAPRDLVWKAWTDPDQIARWWGPEGMETPRETIEMDPRPGGIFKLVMVMGTAEFPSEMEFRAVDEPERLVFAWEPQRGLGAGEVEVTFTELEDGRTELNTRFRGYQTEEMAKMSKLGWDGQLNKLAALLGA